MVVQYLCQLHRQDPSFLFDIQRDENDTMVGVCWQTATMRFDWDTCASCISLDGMKRQLNHFCYPYIAVTSLDGYGNMVVCAEAIVISERIEAYAWLLRCCSNFSSARKLDGIHVIYGDGLVTCQSLLLSLGIQDSCSLLDDVHHLLSTDCGTWYKQFGSDKWNHYGALLRTLVHESYTLEDYEKTRSRILTSMDCRGEPESLYNYFNNIVHAARDRYARYSVRTTPYNEELLGSSVAESNHSSYVARIGGGSWDDPATQVKDCILRMSELSNKRASQRDQYRRQSYANSHTASDETVAIMLVKLSKRGFKICEEEYRKSQEYYYLMVNPHDTSREIKWHGTTSLKPPRVIDGRHCSCHTFIAYQVQCRHLFAFHDRAFRLDLVDQKFHAHPLSVASPNREYTSILSLWVEEREPYVGSLGDKLLPCQSTSISNRKYASLTEQPTDGVVCNDHHDDHDVPLDDDSICSSSQEPMDCMELNSQEKKQSVVTYRDFTDVANSVANLALSLPSEESRRECLGVLVRMRDALSMSAATGLQPSVPLMGFMASAEEFLSAFGPNAESRREGVFQSLPNPGQFEMQRHNIGKVRHKRLTSFTERNVQRIRSRPRPPLTQLSENLHLADARYRPPQCSFCGSGQHTIKSCSIMDKAALVGKKNSAGWNQWYRTLGNQKFHDVALPSAGYALKLNRELQEDLPPPSQIIRHLSIKLVHFSNEAVDFMTRPTSVYRRKTPEYYQIPSPDNNIVEVQRIERGGNFVQRKDEGDANRGASTTFIVRARAVKNGWRSCSTTHDYLFT